MSLDSEGNPRQITLNPDKHENWCTSNDISPIQPVIVGNTIIFGELSKCIDRNGERRTESVVCRSLDDGTAIAVYAATGENVKKILASEKNGKLDAVILLTVDHGYDCNAYVFLVLRSYASNALTGTAGRGPTI